MYGLKLVEDATCYDRISGFLSPRESLTFGVRDLKATRYALCAAFFFTTHLVLVSLGEENNHKKLYAKQGKAQKYEVPPEFSKREKRKHGGRASVAPQQTVRCHPRQSAKKKEAAQKETETVEGIHKTRGRSCFSLVV